MKAQVQASRQEPTQDPTRASTHEPGSQAGVAAAYRAAGFGASAQSVAQRALCDAVFDSRRTMELRSQIAEVDASPRMLAQRALCDAVFGSRRTMQLRSQIAEVDASSRMLAQRAQLAGMFGAHALQRVPAATLSPAGAVVQRLSKDAIDQPGGDDVQSDIVPDLTAALVTRIQQANTEDLRRTVLNDLLAYLDARGAVDDMARTEIAYSAANTGNLGVTMTVGMNDDDPVRITIYAAAFAAGPAILYSTLRHELIHVAQRQLVPDEANAEYDDNYMHENLYDQDVGVPTRLTLQLPLQEIETYTWELLHAGETGVSGAYQAATCDGLVGFMNEVIAFVENDDQCTQNTFLYWHDYLMKAVELLHDAFVACNYAPLNVGANRLAARIFVLADEAEVEEDE